MPGIIGRREGKRHVSAGTRATGERNTAKIPTTKAAIKVAPMMCMPMPIAGFMRMNLRECPTAAVRAQ